MKRVLLISVLAMFIFSGCFLIDHFAESTVRIVNESELDVTAVGLRTGEAGRGFAFADYYNILAEGEVIKPGSSIILGLAPVLHENSYVYVELQAPDDDDMTDDYPNASFLYEEGAEVVLIFNADEKEPFKIENGVFLDTK